MANQKENLTDFNAYRREIMRLSNCLAMARVSYQIDDDSEANRYLQCAKGYFDRIAKSLE